MHKLVNFAFIVFEAISIYLLFCLIAYFVRTTLDTSLFEPIGLLCIVYFHFYQILTRLSHLVFVTAEEISLAFLLSVFCFIFDFFCSFGLFAFVHLIDAVTGSGCLWNPLLRWSTSFRRRFGS